MTPINGKPITVIPDSSRAVFSDGELEELELSLNGGDEDITLQEWGDESEDE